MITTIFLIAIIIFLVFIVVRQEQMIRSEKAEAKRQKFNAESNFVRFENSARLRRNLEEEKENLKLEVKKLNADLEIKNSLIYNLKKDLQGNEILIINLHTEIKNLNNENLKILEELNNIKQLLNNN
jgi:hypothetical protein